jgi:hypothetical protein
MSTVPLLSQVGRSYFEMVQYADALKAFEQSQCVEPHRLCGMEVHSTILWHLKREVALCYLGKRGEWCCRLRTHAPFRLRSKVNRGRLSLLKGMHLNPGLDSTRVRAHISVRVLRGRQLLLAAEGA